MPKYILTIHGKSFRISTYNDARIALAKRYPEARIDHAPADCAIRLDGLGLQAFEAAYYGKGEKYSVFGANGWLLARTATSFQQPATSNQQPATNK